MRRSASSRNGETTVLPEVHAEVLAVVPEDTGCGFDQFTSSNVSGAYCVFHMAEKRVHTSADVPGF